MQEVFLFFCIFRQLMHVSMSFCRWEQFQQDFCRNNAYHCSYWFSTVERYKRGNFFYSVLVWQTDFFPGIDLTYSDFRMIFGKFFQNIFHHCAFRAPWRVKFYQYRSMAVIYLFLKFFSVTFTIITAPSFMRISFLYTACFPVLRLFVLLCRWVISSCDRGHDSPWNWEFYTHRQKKRAYRAVFCSI